MPKGKKKKGPEPASGLAARATRSDRAVRSAARAARADQKNRKQHKLDLRKKDRKQYTANQWAIPAPSHLVATLERPTHKSRYHSYFEFAENTEKKKNKLEYKVTTDSQYELHTKQSS